MKYLFESLNKSFKVGGPAESSSKYLPIDDEDGVKTEMNVTSNLDGGEGPPRTPLVFKTRNMRLLDSNQLDECVRALCKHIDIAG